MNNRQRAVHLQGLGLCEHCGTLVTIEDIPENATIAGWKCSRCGGGLSAKTFGFGKPDGVLRKIQWVGINGQWTKIKPTENFSLGGWRVLFRPKFRY